MKLSIQEYVPLAPFTTLGVGGAARYFIHAHTKNAVVEAVEFARSKRVPLFVLGGGSNLLIADEGFPGLVARIELGGLDWADEGKHVRLNAGAGEDWDRVVANSIDQELSGFECLSGIPGSVGGTPVQNVGAYGQEISETLCSVHAYDREIGNIVDLSPAECRFAYRSSIFNTSAIGRYIVLRVSYRLTKNGNPTLRYPDLQREFEKTPAPSLAAVRDAVRRIRAGKAMLLQPGDPDCRSAGSFFKNPVVTKETFNRLEAGAAERVPAYPASDGYVKLSAAWLIEKSGITKGYSRGAAGVSTKHTLALVNKGGASAAEIIALAREIRNRVQDRFGVTLMPEPVFVGDFAKNTLEIKS